MARSMWWLTGGFSSSSSSHSSHFFFVFFLFSFHFPFDSSAIQIGIGFSDCLCCFVYTIRAWWQRMGVKRVPLLICAVGAEEAEETMNMWECRFAFFVCLKCCYVHNFDRFFSSLFYHIVSHHIYILRQQSSTKRCYLIENRRQKAPKATTKRPYSGMTAFLSSL